MTPKEKAAELFNEYYSYLKANLMYDEEAKEDAKQCALIAVDEVLKYSKAHGFIGLTEEYEQIKLEIENL